MKYESIEETDVEGYLEETGWKKTLRTATVAGIAALFSVSCAGNPVPHAGAEPEPESNQHATYRGDSPQGRYDVEVDISYRGQEDDDELHLPPNCKRMEITLDWDQIEAGTRDPNYEVGHATFTDTDCDGDIESGLTRFRDSREQRRYNSSFAFRTLANDDATNSATYVVFTAESEE